MKRMLLIFGLILATALVVIFFNIVLTPQRPEFKRAEVISFSYSDFEQTQFLIDVLESLHMKYSMEQTEQTTTVNWQPSNPVMNDEIKKRVSQYLFIRDVCKKLPIPLPSDIAKAELSCPQ